MEPLCWVKTPSLAMGRLLDEGPASENCHQFVEGRDRMCNRHVPCILQPSIVWARFKHSDVCADRLHWGTVPVHYVDLPSPDPRSPIPEARIHQVRFLIQGRVFEVLYASLVKNIQRMISATQSE